MYKFVDSDKDDPLEGFAYVSKDGKTEGVSLDGDIVEFVYTSNNNSMTCIYVSDIPKMIKALQAAYDYKGGGK